MIFTVFDSTIDFHHVAWLFYVGQNSRPKDRKMRRAQLDQRNDHDGLFNPLCSLKYSLDALSIPTKNWSQNAFIHG